MSEITDRAEKWIFAANFVETQSSSELCVAAYPIVNDLLAETTQLRADLKIVSLALLEAHGENCTLCSYRVPCICENGADFCFHHGSSDYHGCRHYKPCECPACKVAGENVA